MNSSRRIGVFVLFFALLVLCGYTKVTASSLLAPPGCNGQRNTNPIQMGEPRFVNETKNGKRYIIGSGNSYTHLIQVYGTPYEMGYAAGTLMKEELKQQIKIYFDYLEEQIEEYLKIIPHFLQHYVAEWGLKAALDLTWELTRAWTPSRYIEEIQGMADASGVNMKDIRRLNLLPELIKAACSIIGSWGPASQNGTLYQLRALDWDKNAPISKFPLITVYHPSEKGSFVFANMGYVGLVGTITGYSSARIGISEKVWFPPKEEEDLTSRLGKPWNYVLRDVLQFGTDLDNVLSRFANEKRTCAIHIGVGDSNTGEFRGVEYSAKELNFYDWMTQPEYKEHPRMKGMVYWDKHVQPSHNPCLGSLLSENYGKITPETILRDIIPLHQTGDTQVAVFDFQQNKVYISYSRPFGDESGPLEAYARPFMILDMNKIFAEKQ